MPDRSRVRWSQLKVGAIGLTAFIILFVLVFLLTVVVAYVYAWRRGVFQWR